MPAAKIVNLNEIWNCPAAKPQASEPRSEIIAENKRCREDAEHSSCERLRVGFLDDQVSRFPRLYVFFEVQSVVPRHLNSELVVR